MNKRDDQLCLCEPISARPLKRCSRPSPAADIAEALSGAIENVPRTGRPVIVNGQHLSATMNSRTVELVGRSPS